MAMFSLSRLGFLSGKNLVVQKIRYRYGIRLLGIFAVLQFFLCQICHEVSSCDCDPNVQRGMMKDAYFNDGRCLFDDVTCHPHLWLHGSARCEQLDYGTLTWHLRWMQ